MSPQFYSLHSQQAQHDCVVQVIHMGGNDYHPKHQVHHPLQVGGVHVDKVQQNQSEQANGRSHRKKILPESTQPQHVTVRINSVIGVNTSVETNGHQKAVKSTRSTVKLAVASAENMSMAGTAQLALSHPQQDLVGQHRQEGSHYRSLHSQQAHHRFLYQVVLHGHGEHHHNQQEDHPLPGHLLVYHHLHGHTTLLSAGNLCQHRSLLSQASHCFLGEEATVGHQVEPIVNDTMTEYSSYHLMAGSTVPGHDGGEEEPIDHHSHCEGEGESRDQFLRNSFSCIATTCVACTDTNTSFSSHLSLFIPANLCLRYNVVT